MILAPLAPAAVLPGVPGVGAALALPPMAVSAGGGSYTGVLGGDA